MIILKKMTEWCIWISNFHPYNNDEPDICHHQMTQLDYKK